MFIPKETIEQVRERAAIEEIVKRYVPSLKKRGQNYVGLCPFHKEKTPSFSVNPAKQICYCFGCHTGGNVFSFISKIERLDFPESVKLVADIVGIEIKSEENREKGGRFDEINRYNTFAMNYYHKYLLSGSGKTGMDYLLKRGVTRESIETFKLGYAPDSWNFLVTPLQKNRANMEIAESIGLLSSSKKEQRIHYYDKFRSRVIFPIFDKNGRAIAFGGRVLGDGQPKYLNSPESDVFKKRYVLYGLDQAMKEIRELGRAIVVEGYLDVIGCWQGGVKNVVAPLGTALTGTQVEQLARNCKEIVLLFDSDSAGINAALKSLAIIEEVNVEVKVAMLPEGDPFDFILQKGVREFMAVVDSSMKPIEFKIQQIMKNSEQKGRVNTLLALFFVIKEIPYETERSVYLKSIGSQLGIDENSIRADFANYLKKGVVKNIPVVDKQNNKELGYIAIIYRGLVELLCNHPDLVEQAVIDFTVSEIPDELSRKILTKIAELYFSDEDFSIDKMFDFFPAGVESEFLNQSLNSEHKVEDPKSAYTEIYIKMKLQGIEEKMTRYAELVKRPGGAQHQYLAEFEVLRREKEKLTQYLNNKR
ncbi:MAG: DNA primase [bacterium]|nr:DNA primase [bacterium]